MADTSSDGTGCLIALLIIVAIGLGIMNAEHGRQREREAEEQKAIEWASERVPSAQAMIEELSTELARCESRLNKVHTKCQHLGIDPANDEDFCRWRDEAEELRGHLNSLIFARNTAYLESYKAGLDTDPERNRIYHEKTVSALQVAQRAKEAIQKHRQMNRSSGRSRGGPANARRASEATMGGSIFKEGE